MNFRTLGHRRNQDLERAGSPRPEPQRCRILPFLLAAIVAPGVGAAQDRVREPDRADVRYGPHERNVLDLWKAAADRPTPLVIHIHGGGFRKGDKRTVRPSLVNACLERGLSVASINYRFSDRATYPAAMLDGTRAVQFLRSRAREFGLDPDAFGATGGSAGGAMSLWIGLHDDLADAENDDPVLRQSSRLRAVAVQEAQTTLDPRVIARLINEETARFPSLPPFFGVPAGRDVLTATEFFPAYEASSPVTHVTPDDPPVLLLYRRPTAPPAADDTMTGIHHARFGRLLKEKMDAAGVACVVKTPDDYEGRDVAEAMERDLIDFFTRHLKGGRTDASPLVRRAGRPAPARLRIWDRPKFPDFGGWLLDSSAGDQQCLFTPLSETSR